MAAFRSHIELKREFDIPPHTVLSCAILLCPNLSYPSLSYLVRASPALSQEPVTQRCGQSCPALRHVRTRQGTHSTY
jgi:hypothetical protein